MMFSFIACLALLAGAWIIMKQWFPWEMNLIFWVFKGVARWLWKKQERGGRTRVRPPRIRYRG